MFLNLECKNNSDTYLSCWCLHLSATMCQEWDHVVRYGEQPARGSGHANWTDFQDDKKERLGEMAHSSGVSEDKTTTVYSYT